MKSAKYIFQVDGFCSDSHSEFLSTLYREAVRDHLADLSLFQHELCLEKLLLASTILLDRVYEIFGIEPLHDVHLGTLQLLKECTLKYLGSYGVMANLGGPVQHK